MKFYNEEDLANGNYEKFCQKIDDIRKRGQEKRKLIKESTKPKFNTIEEALDYYHKQGCLTFAEWEKGMFERLGDKAPNISDSRFLAEIEAMDEEYTRLFQKKNTGSDEKSS